MTRAEAVALRSSETGKAPVDFIVAKIGSSLGLQKGRTVPQFGGRKLSRVWNMVDEKRREERVT